MVLNDIKNAFIHLRIPFGILLMPVFLYTLSEIDSLNDLSKEVIYLFCILHLLVYPSSNGYNSYMDNDTTSIGGLKSPPKVPSLIFPITIILDVLALGMSYVLFGLPSFSLLIVYILASRAYSYRKIRLKKYPIIGYLTVCLCQGVLIFLLTKMALERMNLSDVISINALISFLLVGAGYPLSQIYQHKADEADGVHTISMLLGIKGTFIFSGVLFFLLLLCFLIKYLLLSYQLRPLVIFLIMLSPVMILFLDWMKKVYKDESNANYDYTMRLNQVGAVCMNLFFITLIILKYR
jgi:1,4-dihydroxy-2-naphthoate polyprenyltransferase